MTTQPDTESGGPLAGLVVIDLSTTLPGAQASQFLADCGADVIMVEPPGGSPLREIAGWPGLLRGKRSITLDLHDVDDLARLRRLLANADVLVSTMRPTSAARIGLTAEVLAERYPRLVTAMITGWGSTGPWAGYKGWEGLVLAKTGVMHAKRQLTKRPGPAYVSTPYASFGAAQTAVHGILAALIERESSGAGQLIESNLVLGMGSMDTYNWFYEMVLQRYPDAFEPMDSAYDNQDRPQAYLVYALLSAPTKDGRWLQFAQVSPRLMQAWLIELGLVEELANPKWKGFPMLESVELRTEFWEMMHERVGARTYDEWQQVFETNHNISAEPFRTPDEGLEHPQVVHDGRAVIVEDPELGAVRQPSTMIHSEGRPLTSVRPAPRAGEHSDQISSWLQELVESPATDGAATHSLPLDGVTVVEFGTMFAGPYGATMLTDLGARVIKIEPLEGDNIRSLVAFPEAGGAKVLQGKESVAVDLTSPEGRELVYEIVKRSDLVLECFRGGAAERAKVDEASLKKINPDLVYLSAPGYGVDGPYAQRPAYAPSIGAASGISVTDGGNATTPPTDRADLRRKAVTMHTAGATPAVQSDGIAALGVASAMLVGLYAKRKGIEVPAMVTTMIGTAAQALIAFNTNYADRPEIPKSDDQFYGLGALYRLYQASDGWVFLAAPTEKEWPGLVKALSVYVDLESDERFSTATARRDNDGVLAETLSIVFAGRRKQEWEDELTRQDVGCVAAAEANPESVLQTDPFFEAGYSVEAVSPIFDEHRRLAPLNKFSRSLTKADAGCTIGQHTRPVLREIGVEEARIADLCERKIIVCDD
ncbi:CaiB/BaiF family protein [Rhodococcus wratislaviensis]|uniref:CaiB/BaiF family protein n=1 Tax=Rhodococcus wratislaviensis TaxID=44752 RepID=A0A402CL76_RHOWR|nr:CoA transferase [Rhodococcus wratislaviensis]GCE44289.1 CaiB/BaiF family protein [Rhodococcus wratislaviensis]